jgi:TorA maturation chaperone TorD
MNACTTTTATIPAASGVSVPLARARLYHFLELALAHPGEDGFDYFRQEATSAAFDSLILDLQAQAVPSMRSFFDTLNGHSFEQAESAHIALFSANFPQVPCPPYGSLFTAEDDSKRLDEMLAIKEFYQRAGMDVATSFDDLPDHLCVELEFMQLLCFREDDAVAVGDEAMAEGARRCQAEFLDRFLLPFIEPLTTLALRADTENPYSHLLAATNCLLAFHRSQIGESSP